MAARALRALRVLGTATFVLAVVGALALGTTWREEPAAASHGPCYTALDPSTDGPRAPTQLVVRTIGAAGSFGFELNWQDNATDETCYVVEQSLPFEFAGSWLPITRSFSFVLPANSTSYRDSGPYAAQPTASFRVYAATATKRSMYAGDPLVRLATATALPFTAVPPTATPPPTLARQIEACAGAVRSVWEHDNERQEWRTYVPGAPAGVNTFTGFMRPGEPYWLVTDRECTLPAPTQRLQLYTGGNLVIWR